MSLTTLLISPSSVWIGVASFCVVTSAVQPGVFSGATPTIGGSVGNTISILVVAVSSSFGTWNEMS